MIKNLLILCVLSTIAVCHTKAQLVGTNCHTPDNQNGICVHLPSCNSSLSMISQAEDKLFLQRSRCGDQEDVVCCPDATALRFTTTRRPYTTTMNTSTDSFKGSVLTRSNYSISTQKCSQYADFAYNKTYTINPFGPPLVIKRSNCGFISMGLVGGTNAQLREFPHMALIGFEFENKIHWSCGGTLISEQFVLSAAHCSDLPRLGPAEYVRLGEHDRNITNDAIHMDFDIIEKFFHENIDQIIYNDIVLFKLDREVAFNHAIRPACLPVQSSVPNRLTASGWGYVRSGGISSNVLLKVDLEAFSQDELLKTDIGKLFSERFNEETIVFAGHHTESHDTCQGDSGGPIQILHETHHCTYTVVGVTSTGDICGQIGVPAIYTRVYNHLRWIEDTVWPNQEKKTNVGT